jgi:hypothetical protein
MDLENVVVYDSESDGFVYDATKIHVISIIPALSTDNEMASYYGNTIEDGLQRLADARVIVAHNQIKHDILLFQKLYPDWTPPLVLDTLVLSALLNPERLGGHSIEAWGRRMGGEQKVVHEDWSTFSFAMLQRCESDTRLNKRVLHRLLKESYADIDGVDIYNFNFGDDNAEDI